MDVDALLPTQIARSALRRKVLVESFTPGRSRNFRHCYFESAQELLVLGMMRTQLSVDRGNLQMGESRPTSAMKVPPKFGCSSLASLSSSSRRRNLSGQRGSPGGRQG